MMKTSFKFAAGILLLFTFVAGIGLFQVRPEVAQAQQLQGEQAHAFMAQADILKQIATAEQPRLFQQTADLAASDGRNYDDFGYAVAVQGDTAVIGARNLTVGDNLNQGAVYVFVRSDGAWSEQQKLVAGDGRADSYFGSSVALDGDTIMIGAPYMTIDFTLNLGAVYVFTRNGSTWSEQQKLVSDIDRMFGSSVALDGDTAIIGTQPDFDYFEPEIGAAFVFKRTAGTWSEQQKLAAGDDADSYGFGITVALDGDTAVVSAPESAYIFTRSAGAWSEQQKLIAGDGKDNWFADSFAVQGNTIAIGAPGQYVAGGGYEQGAVYLFTRSGTTWSQEQKLIAADGTGVDHFGISVAIDGERLIAGAVSACLICNYGRGAAYIYTRGGATWNQRQKLVIGDGTTEEAFAFSVALDGETAVIGAPFPNDAGVFGPGRAYVFEQLPLQYNLYLPAIALAWQKTGQAGES